MRYLPSPRGQRARTWATDWVYSFTRPLILETALDTLMDLPENGAGILEERLRPLPLPT